MTLYKTDSLAKKIIYALIIGIVFGLSSCSPPKDDNVLIVGMELAYPPFEMTDEQNHPAGISVDMANALGRHLGKEVRIENTPFAGLIPALRTEKIDIIISSLSATEKRRKTIDFSDPYLSTGLCILVHKDSKISGIEDLDNEDSIIAVKQGTTGHTYAVENIENAKVLLFDKESAAVLEVTQGKSDAFIYDQISTYMNWQRNIETTRAILTPFKQESWAIGIDKGNDNLREQINSFLKEYKEAGAFEELGDKYLKKQKEDFAKLGIPFYF